MELTDAVMFEAVLARRPEDAFGSEDFSDVSRELAFNQSDDSEYLLDVRFDESEERLKDFRGKAVRARMVMVDSCKGAGGSALPQE